MKHIRFFILLVFLTGCSTKVKEAEPLAEVKIEEKTSVTLALSAQPTSIKIMSWNMKHLGRKKLDYTSSTKLLKQADLITIQEVNTTESGKEALTQLSNLLEKATGERFCKGLSDIPTGAKERYAYLWIDAKVSFVQSNGKVIENCPAQILTVSLNTQFADKIVREPAVATFQVKGTKFQFILASIHLVPTEKKPEKEVPYLFQSMMNETLPVIITGDFDLGAENKAFDVARKLQFHATFKNEKTSLKMKTRELNEPYDNFWSKGLHLKNGKVLNLYTEFPKIKQKEIYDNLSDHSPIMAVGF